MIYASTHLKKDCVHSDFPVTVLNSVVVFSFSCTHIKWVGDTLAQLHSKQDAEVKLIKLSL